MSTVRLRELARDCSIRLEITRYSRALCYTPRPVAVRCLSRVIIIISLLMSPLLWCATSVGIVWFSGLPYGLTTRRTDHNPPRGPSLDWWVLTTPNSAGTYGLRCLAKHGGARANKFLITHPTTDQYCYPLCEPNVDTAEAHVHLMDRITERTSHNHASNPD
jgi:hypothetical protein